MNINENKIEYYAKITKALNEQLIIQEDLSNQLLRAFNKIKNREMSIAITNLEQAIHWANKSAITAYDKGEKN